MPNIASKFHYFSSQSRKSKSKISILFFFFLLLSSFPSNITQKVYSVYKRSTDQANALLSVIFLLLVRAACELRFTSYGPKCTPRKLKVVIGRFTYMYQTIALLSDISILLVRAVCEIRLVSYESKHGTQLLFDTTFCAYLHS